MIHVQCFHILLTLVGCTLFAVVLPICHVSKINVIVLMIGIISRGVLLKPPYSFGKSQMPVPTLCVIQNKHTKKYKFELNRSF